MSCMESVAVFICLKYVLTLIMARMKEWTDSTLGDCICTHAKYRTNTKNSLTKIF